MNGVRRHYNVPPRTALPAEAVVVLSFQVTPQGTFQPGREPRLVAPVDDPAALDRGLRSLFIAARAALLQAQRDGVFAALTPAVFDHRREIRYRFTAAGRVEFL
jgi:hypothetical protein